MALDRSKKNIFVSWWWTVDKLTLFAISFLICFGVMMVATASPAIAERIGFGSFYFVKKQIIFLSVGVLVLFLVSLMSIEVIKIFGMIGFAIGIIFLLAVLVFGQDINGASRWLSIGGFSFQPSEFVKPFFIVVTALILSISKNTGSIKDFKYAFIIYVVFVLLLVLQPDFGMTVVATSTWFAQLLLAGLSLMWIGIFAIVGVLGILSAYTFLPHVTARIDTFLAKKDANDAANYQVQKSLEAFYSGGLFGRGPWEGIVKQKLPDSHTDFIFAVIGEELGSFFCIFLVLVFGFIVVRGLKRIYEETDLFICYSVAGLIIEFGLQAMVNMGVSLHLLPNKGMTLPFVSYGGSSVVAICIAMGMVLSLTRKRYGVVIKPSVKKSFNLRNI